MKMSSEKKKIFGVILSFLLVLSMSVPVMAEDENYPRYLDDAGLLSSSPVSYTHLDVYKRQQQIRLYGYDTCTSQR